ncbi:MAG TPA: S8 family serine peptidase [Solirubrobacterales bacterium]|nr:S8 family serine peptidase [Solirubrobacterales bacterium]
MWAKSAGLHGKRAGVAACLLLSFLVLGLAAIQPAARASDNSIIPGHYVVTLNPSVAHPGVVGRRQAGAYGGKVEGVYRLVLNGYAAELPRSAVVALHRDPRVVSVTPDHRVELLEEEVGIETENNEGVELLEATTPTGINRVFAPANKALDIDKTDDLRANVDVAVIDTGIDFEHPDLNVAGRVNCETATCLANSGTDGNSHGTHVAGTIAALDNGEGVVGVAPGAKLWAVKVLANSGFGSESAVIAGVEWVTSHASEIEIANMSLGCFCTMTKLEEAINKSVEAGVVYVVAAGNSNLDAKNFSPAKNANVITVSAINDYDGKSGGSSSFTCANYGSDDQKASYSNYGAGVDLAAPGSCILSTEPGNKYGYKSGTSMASPHVAGAAAILAAEQNPNSKADVEAIRTKLVNAGNKGWTDTSGDGVQEPLLDVSSETTFWLPRWTIETTPNASGAEQSELYDMACEPSSTSTCTAVGSQTASGGTSTPYAQYWNGSSWANQSTATPAGTTAAELQADYCLSKTSCVAAGSYTTASGTFSLIESWNGTSWSVQTSPNPSGATETHLKGMSCKEITACIAVGYSGTGSTSSLVAMKGSSGTWSLQTVPLPTGVGAVGGELTGVDCVSTTSCTAVGRYYVTASTYWGMISTWNGTTWTTQVAPKPTGEPKRSTLLDISCSSSSSCAAVGGYLNKSSVQVTYVVKWNGTSWSWQESPNPTGSTNTPLQNVSCVASSPCVAVGDWLDSSGVWRPMSEYWNGTAWVIEPVEIPSGETFGVLEGVACRTSCLTIGWYTASSKNKTLGETRKWPS